MQFGGVGGVSTTVDFEEKECFKIYHKLAFFDMITIHTKHTIGCALYEWMHKQTNKQTTNVHPFIHRKKAFCGCAHTEPKRTPD